MQKPPIAHHQPTDAKLDPKQYQPQQTSPQVFIAEHILCSAVALWSVGVSNPNCAPFRQLVHPQPTHWWGSGRPWPCVKSI